MRKISVIKSLLTGLLGSLILASSANAAQILVKSPSGEVKGRGELNCTYDGRSYGLTLQIALIRPQYWINTQARSGGSYIVNGVNRSNNLSPYSKEYRSKNPVQLLYYEAVNIIPKVKGGSNYQVYILNGNIQNKASGENWRITDSLNRVKIPAVCPN